MPGPIKLHQQIHFKMNELILFYNFPEVTEEVVSHAPCHHIEKLRCSRAHELSSEECISVRKCELALNKDILFRSAGIDVLALEELDRQLRARKV